MSQGRILLFDSGMGGLTVARSVRHELPFAHLVYSADNAAFPYGAWEEQALVDRILFVMERLIARDRQRSWVSSHSGPWAAGSWRLMAASPARARSAADARADGNADSRGSWPPDDAQA